MKLPEAIGSAIGVVLTAWVGWHVLVWLAYQFCDPSYGCL